MKLIIALCLLCGCVAPHTCRSVDSRDPPAQDLEPFVARHHHEGNIAELLIPLLERSLAQSEARSNERQRRRPKPGKKVIQVLPYPGSEEHKRKGWRKLNSHKKQVVEITPLHGKNGAKPLAYILSAAKPSHVEETMTNDDSASGEREQQLYEEKNVSINILKSAEVSSSMLNNPANIYGSSKDSQTSNKESISYSMAESNDESGNQDEKSSDELSTEFRFARQHGVKSHNHKIIVSDEEKSLSLEDRVAIQREVKSHNHKVIVSDENKSESLENVELTKDDVGSTADYSTSESSEDKLESKNGDLTGESQVTLDNDVTSKSDDTVEQRDLSVENLNLIAENRDSSGENLDLSAETLDLSAGNLDLTPETTGPTAEVRDSSSEYKDSIENGDLAAELDLTAVNRDATADNTDLTAKLDLIAEKPLTPEATLSLEDKSASLDESGTLEQASGQTLNDLSAEEKTLSLEDDTSENTGLSQEIIDPGHTHTHDHHHHTHLDDVNLSAEDKTQILGPDNQIQSRNLIADDIVISHSDSTEKNFGKIFDSNARDIIELIQSSVEASTAKHRDCKEVNDKHSHDHKSYRLSFLFNK
ncbi:uncharacterized protein LOC124644645 [Helicoverpa zea]|uniref:uncharacterized protein LOC124644645 n=1 Tax=Helicoverpa zea TaxID=7113 RepID=UPI001F59422D|nr:uncharacterized protein LOC124644645 [Helicoverpa zea]